VVVDQGASNFSVLWAHLHERLAAGSRVCLYDRAGFGWSNPSQAPATAERAARDLARLTPPRLSPARGPPRPDRGFDPEHTLDLDQTPAFDPAEPEPAPDLESDQSCGA
jgi:pimeloyl-ACP methyl ester carboxylesterase